MLNQPADPIDQASVLTEVANEYAIKNRAKVPTPLPADAELSAEDLECPECGGEIPEKRRRAGYTICVACAEEMGV